MRRTVSRGVPITLARLVHPGSRYQLEGSFSAMTRDACVALADARRAAAPWRNGGGVTRELLRLAARPATGSVRVSVADIEADGPFSPFPGVERWFAVLRGRAASR